MGYAIKDKEENFRQSFQPLVPDLGQDQQKIERVVQRSAHHASIAVLPYFNDGFLWLSQEGDQIIRG